jgi:hypothetical protein
MSKIRFNRNTVKRVKKPKHSTTSKKIIAFIILSIFGFTGLAIYVQLKIGVELSPTLITCFYAFCTGELWMLATIKKSKLKTGQKTQDYANNESNDDEAKG